MHKYINNFNFKHSAAKIVTKIVEVNLIHWNQIDFTVYIGRFDEKSPFVYTSFLGLDETLISSQTLLGQF